MQENNMLSLEYDFVTSHGFIFHMGLWEDNEKDEEIIQTNVLLHCLVRTDSSHPVLVCLIVRL
jgi:hypothetical protein